MTQKHCFIFHKTDSKTTFSKTSSIDSVDLAQVHEIGAYLLRYDSVPESISSLINGSINTSNSSISSGTGATDSNFSKITSNSSITSQDFVHQSCCLHHMDQDKEGQRSFLHKNCTSVPGFFFCVNCGGNFSFQYINPTASVAALTQTQQSPTDNQSSSAPSLNGNVKLCNCFHNSVGDTSSPKIPKSQSADQLMTFRQEIEVVEPAKSHSGIPNQIDNSMEAALDQTERCESGF